ncbi:chitin-binding domain protein cbd-1 [Ceratina calcarata]|uniref:Chitin-binding domain protein cbd-1 n=1 Tax=Ceratina calcarata TaxID=156304 RepID=A0AAJ7J513_9HYME|nr:chitin-binding domain protein cbd-1 [Ceratina calcarata]
MKGFYLLIVAATVAQAIADEYADLNITCIEDYSSCPQEENEDSIAIHLPDPDNCHQFYKCQHGGACIFPCPTYNNGTKQLVFDPVLQVCDFQFNVKLPNCTAEVTPTTSEEPSTGASQSSTPTVAVSASSTNNKLSTTHGTTASTTSGTAASSTSGTAASSTSGTPVSSTDVITEPATEGTTEPTTFLTTLTTPGAVPKSCQPSYACPKVGLLHVKHETDCNYFYRCKNGTKKLTKCPINLVFNCNIQACDFPKNYSCKTTRAVEA